MIDEYTLSYIFQTAIMSVTAPVVAIAVWKIRNKKSLVPFFAGILFYLVFVRLLETIPNTIFLMMDNPASRLLKNQAVLFALYTGLAAGIFEELGRYVAFHVLAGKYQEKQTAVSYGLGHGGIECVLLLGLTNIQYYMYGQLINDGATDKLRESYQGNEQALASFDRLIDTVKNIHSYDCWFAGWERISFMMLQVALSILVYEAVKNGRKQFLVISVLVHAAACIPSALYQRKVLPALTAELLIFVIAGLVLYYAVRLYLGMKKTEEDAGISARKHNLHQLANRRFRDKD